MGEERTSRTMCRAQRVDDNSELSCSLCLQQQMGMGAQPGQQPDMNKIFAAEAENIQLVEHT